MGDVKTRLDFSRSTESMLILLKNLVRESDARNFSRRRSTGDLVGVRGLCIALQGRWSFLFFDI